MPLARLDGLPLNRARFLPDTLQSVYVRKNTDPDSQGEARRLGSTRLHNTKTNGVGVSAHAGLNSHILWDDSTQAALETLFTGTAWSVNFHVTMGGISADSQATKDFTLFRWGGQTGETGSVEILMRATGTNIQFVAIITMDVGTATLSKTLAGLPDPSDDYMVTLVSRGAADHELYLDESTVDTDTTNTGRAVSAAHWGEATALGRSSRAAASGNAEPRGARPTITDLSVWDAEVTFGDGNDVEKDKRLQSTASANLIFYDQLNAGTENQSSEETISSRGNFVPAPPVIDTTNGAILSGESGFIRIAYSPLFDDLFVRRTQFASANEWSFQMLITTPAVMEFPDGDPTLASWGKNGSLLRLEITDTGTLTYQVKATVGNAGSDAAVTSTFTGNLAAATSYLITVSREDSHVNLIVSSAAGTDPPDTVAIDSEYGPDFDEDDPPEVLLGIYFDADTQTYSNRFRGNIRRAIAFQYPVPYAAHSSSFTQIDRSQAFFYHVFKNTKGGRSTDLGLHGISAFFEVEDVAGLEGAPPFWAEGPILDGTYVGCVNGVALTETKAVLPDGTDISTDVKGYLRRTFGNDVTGVRAGSKVLLFSNDRAHVLDEDNERLRPLGLPVPVSRPAIVPSGPGVLDGIAAWGLSFRSRDGTESPLSILPPKVVRNATVRIGGGEDTPGSIYGDSNAGYWMLPDAYSSGFTLTQDGFFDTEMLARLDPKLLLSDFREQTRDRGVVGDSNYTEFWAREPEISPLGQQIKVTEPFSVQLDFGMNNSPETDTEEVLFGIGANTVYSGTDDPPIAVMLTLVKSGSNATFRLYVANGTQNSDDWTATAFSGIAVAPGNHVICLTFNGQDYELFVNGAPHASNKLADQGPPGIDKDQIVHLKIAAGFDGIETAMGGVINTNSVGKGDKLNKYFHMRFWQRAITLGEINTRIENVWFDPDSEGGSTHALLRDYKFATDDPFEEKQRYVCRVSTEEMLWFETEHLNTVVPVEAAPAQEWTVDNKVGRIFTYLTNTPGTRFQSPFQWLWSRIGNGCLLATSYDTDADQHFLLYYAANKALTSTTPTLPTDPQGWGWYTISWESRDHSSATPIMRLSSLWVNGQRVWAGNIDVERDVAKSVAHFADLAGWRDASTWGSNTVEVHLAEVRTWDDLNDHNGENKYLKSADFDHLLRRVQNGLWDEMVHYYQMSTEDSAGTGDIVNNSTRSSSLLDNNATAAALVTTDTGPMPTPPWPDIVATRVYRSPLAPVQDFDDEDELDSLKRLVRNGPFSLVGENPAGLTAFQDSTPNLALALGEPALPTDGFAPRYVRGGAVWGGILVLWGDPPLRLYTADPFDFENFSPNGYLEVPASDFEKVTACIEAGDAFFVFGPNGGLIYRGGRPGRQQPVPVGGGIGAETARCIAAHGGVCYVFGEAGWFAVGADGARQDLGAAYIDLLPSPTAARLQIIGDSLHLIDESDGSSLRLHLPTGKVDQDTRRINSGTFRGSDLYWAHQSGFLASKQTDYADDVQSGQDLTGTATGGSGTTLVDSGGTFTVDGDGAVGQWVRLVRAADGSTETRAVVSNTATTLTVAAWTSTAPANGDTWHLGEYETIVDTGFFQLEEEDSHVNHIDLVRKTGTWEIGFVGTDGPSDPADDSGLVYDTFTATDRNSRDKANRFHRLALRNRVPEASEIVGAYLNIESLPQETPVSDDA